MGLCSSKNNNNQDKQQTHQLSCYQRCCKTGGFEVRVNSVLEALSLTFEQKRIIRKRLVKQVVNLEEDTTKVTFRYNFCRIIIGLGSMALPSLQGLQGQEVGEFQHLPARNPHRAQRKIRLGFELSRMPSPRLYSA